MHKLFYVLRQTKLLLGESKKIAFISILFLIIGMLTLGSTYIIGQKLFETSFTLEKKVNITVFFKINSSQDDVTNAVSAIQMIDGVKSIDVKTSEEAKQDFLTLFPQYKDFLDSLKNNPIPYTATITLSELNSGDRIQDIIRSLPVVDTVIFSGETAKKLKNLVTIIWSLFIAILVVVIAEFAFTIQSSTSFLVDFRKNEIRILKLVGADTAFIELPFIFIASLMSLVAWIISIFALVRVNTWSNAIVQELLPFSAAVTNIKLNILFVSLLIISLIVSVLGSLGPLRRNF